MVLTYAERGALFASGIGAVVQEDIEGVAAACLECFRRPNSSAGRALEFKKDRPTYWGSGSGCGTDLRFRPSMFSKSAGLHVKSGRLLASATAAIIAS